MIDSQFLLHVAMSECSFDLCDVMVFVSLISATNPSQLPPKAEPSQEEQLCESEPPTLRTPDVEPATIDYSLKLKPGEQIRGYQAELAEPGIKGENYIICAPTSTGKTLVAGLIISKHLQKRKRDGKSGKVIFMVNTKPLATQQRRELQKMIPGASVNCCTGDDAVLSTIQTLIKEEDVIVCTAGKLLNELKEDSKVRLDQISLIVIDECHHTRKSAPYAKVMGCYLEEKQSGKGELPQVVGLTASPGAGENPRLDLKKTQDHLYSLCALMDATSGIKTVSENIEELEKHTNESTFRLEVLPSRDCSEAFIAIITKEMVNLETMVALRCPFQRWSQQYETAIQQKKQPLEMEPSPEHRDAINTLKLLRCYSQTLNIYMDLRYEDAIAVLDQFSDLPTMEQATSHERKLIQNLESLKSELVKLPKVRNPLLIHVEEKLNSHFSGRPESKGICFVRTKKHAHAICEWISKLSSESGVEIRPKEFVGHTRETGPGMTQVDQEDVMKGFQEGKYNILVATSVAEEGLDVPACNLVIRFQHVSNEIARKQTMGRARAAESEGYTILSSDSKKPYQEMKNEDLDALVTEALLYLPTGERLRENIMEKQKEIIRELNLRRQLCDERKVSKGARASIKLKCKVCKTLACKGSDIYKAESHYVVSDEDFEENKIVTNKYPSPKKIAANSRMARTGVISCKNCGTEWGGMCIWPSAGYELPTLKCKNFIFEIEGYPRPVRKWTEAPFDIPPLSSHPKYQGLED